MENYFEQYLATMRSEDDSVVAKLNSIMLRAKIIKDLMMQATREGKLATSTLRKFLIDKMVDHRAGVRNKQEQELVLADILSNQVRSASLWFIDNPEQVAWVRKNKPLQLSARGMQAAWAAHRKATLTKAKDENPGDNLEDIASALAAVLFTDAEPILDQMIEIGKKQEKAAAEAVAEKAAKATPITEEIVLQHLSNNKLIELLAAHPDLKAITDEAFHLRAQREAPAPEPVAEVPTNAPAMSPNNFNVDVPKLMGRAVRWSPNVTDTLITKAMKKGTVLGLHLHDDTQAQDIHVVCDVLKDGNVTFHSVRLPSAKAVLSSQSTSGLRFAVGAYLDRTHGVVSRTYNIAIGE